MDQPTRQTEETTRDGGEPAGESNREEPIRPPAQVPKHLPRPTRR